MELFDGDESKVKELEKRIADDFGFAGVVPVSGQTYSRKIDAQTLATLAGIDVYKRQGSDRTAGIRPSGR